MTQPLVCHDPVRHPCVYHDFLLQADNGRRRDVAIIATKWEIVIGVTQPVQEDARETSIAFATCGFGETGKTAEMEGASAVVVGTEEDKLGRWGEVRA